MIAVLVVSHSRALAQAALELAGEMVAGPDAPRVALAAGLDDAGPDTTRLGTDAAAIAAALEELDGPDGTLVLMDLGSALLSAEMALELVDAEMAARVRLSPAPLVEGLVVAVVAAAAGAGLDDVDAQARQALAGKGSHLDGAAGAQGDPAPRTAPPADAPASSGGDQAPGGGPGVSLRCELPLADPHGLHTRPSAALVEALSRLDVQARIGRPGGDLADGRSLTALAGLGLAGGETMLVCLQGPDAVEALARIQALVAPVAATREEPTGALPPAGADVLQLARHRLLLEPDASGYRRGDDERARLQAAMGRVDEFLLELAESAPSTSTEATVLGAVRALLHDPQVIKGFGRQLDEGCHGVEAVRTTMAEAAARFEAMPSAYFRERAVDLRALGRLVVNALLGADLRLPQLPEGHALEVHELDAVVAAQLDARRTPVVVVRTPGESGHGVMVARSRGIRVAVWPG